MVKKEIIGIYCIENLINSKKYVGKSVNIDRRHNEHIDDLRQGCHPNKHLQRAWNLYGECNFKFFIIEECEADELNDREIYWINQYDAYINGYNMTRGGDGSAGYLHDKETKEKMSKIKKEQFKDVENREKLSNAHAFESIPIYQINLCGEIVKEWCSANWAAKTLGFEYARIYEVLNHLNRKKTYGGYIWIYVDQYDQNTFDLDWYINRKWNYMPIYQYNFDGKFLKEFNTVIEAEKEGFNRESIYRCLNEDSKFQSYKGYMWRRYKVDQIEPYKKRRLKVGDN